LFKQLPTSLFSLIVVHYERCAEKLAYKRLKEKEKEKEKEPYGGKEDRDKRKRYLMFLFSSIPIILLHYILLLDRSNCREHEESDDTSEDEAEKDRRKKKGTYDFICLYMWSCTLLVGGQGSNCLFKVCLLLKYLRQINLEWFFMTSTWPTAPSFFPEIRTAAFFKKNDFWYLNAQHT
jgi:hypothetical protein